MNRYTLTPTRPLSPTEAARLKAVGGREISHPTHQSCWSFASLLSFEAAKHLVEDAKASQ